MTIFFPDLSSFQAGLKLEANTVFVWARATMGTGPNDTSYADFKAQAKALGIPFGAYHFLWAGNGAAQADNAFSVVGKDVPLFVDVEPDGSSFPTTNDVNAFVARYRALGGICLVQYYPKFYADSQGANLASTGLLTINANYTTYSDSGPGWTFYDGVNPFQWQYTDSMSYGGQSVDFNAYKGTISEYLSAVGYPVAPPPPPPPPTTPEDDEMQQIEPLSIHPGEYAYGLANKGHVRIVADGLGATATLRVVLWEGTAPNVVMVNVGKDYVDLPISPSLTTAVTVRREDSGEFPVGITAY